MKLAFEDLLEGETPIDDISGLKVEGISTRRQLAEVEAENIRKVLVKYFGRDLLPTPEEFDVAWARNLHREMYGDVWDWAGEFRTRDFNIGLPWAQVQENFYQLLANLRVWQETGMDLIEQAARLHHRAVEIHPFVNGNGRWGRTLTNIWLAINGSPDAAWPEDLIGDTSPIRRDYIIALQAGDQGDIDPLLEMHRTYLRPQ